MLGFSNLCPTPPIIMMLSIFDPGGKPRMNLFLGSFPKSIILIKVKHYLYEIWIDIPTIFPSNQRPHKPLVSPPVKHDIHLVHTIVITNGTLHITSRQSGRLSTQGSGVLNREVTLRVLLPHPLFQAHFF